MSLTLSEVRMIVFWSASKPACSRIHGTPGSLDLELFFCRFFMFALISKSKDTRSSELVDYSIYGLVNAIREDRVE